MNNITITKELTETQQAKIIWDADTAPIYLEIRVGDKYDTSGQLVSGYVDYVRLIFGPAGLFYRETTITIIAQWLPYSNARKLSVCIDNDYVGRDSDFAPIRYSDFTAIEEISKGQWNEMLHYATKLLESV